MIGNKDKPPANRDRMDYYNHTLVIEDVGQRLEQFQEGDTDVEQTESSVVDYIGRGDHRREVEKRVCRGDKPIVLEQANGSITYLIGTNGLVFHEAGKDVFSIGHVFCVAADFECHLGTEDKNLKATFHLFAGGDHQMRVSMLRAIQAMKKNGIVVKSGRLFGRNSQYLGFDINTVAEGIEETSGISIKAVKLDLPAEISEYDLLVTHESHQAFPHIISERLLIKDKVQNILEGGSEDFSR